MRNFDYMKLSERMWDTEIVSYIAKIHECKGRQELFVRQKPVELERLVEIARVQRHLTRLKVSLLQVQELSNW